MNGPGSRLSLPAGALPLVRAHDGALPGAGRIEAGAAGLATKGDPLGVSQAAPEPGFARPLRAAAGPPRVAA